MKKLLPILLIFCLTLAFSETPKEYSNAYKLYSSGKYDDASKLFNQFIDKHPDDYLTGNCFYWLGMIDYKKENYHDALLKFERVLLSPNPDKYKDALLKVGHSYEKIEEPKKALIAYKKILTLKHPNYQLISEKDKAIVSEHIKRLTR